MARSGQIVLNHRRHMLFVGGANELVLELAGQFTVNGLLQSGSNRRLIHSKFQSQPLDPLSCSRVDNLQRHQHHDTMLRAKACKSVFCCISFGANLKYKRSPLQQEKFFALASLLVTHDGLKFIPWPLSLSGCQEDI